LFHASTDDPLVAEDDVVEMQAHLLLLEKSVEVVTHEGTRHFFAESGVPVLDSEGNSGERSPVEAVAAEAAMEQTLEFLRAHQSSSV
jgi:dienelactone hydrolase